MLYLLELGFIGLCIAVLPLGWVLLRRDPSKYRKLAWVATFLTLDLIMFGGFTRLTDSGLGCPDWPGCYGTSSPFAAHADIHAAQVLLPRWRPWEMRPCCAGAGCRAPTAAAKQHAQHCLV